ncbi:hypothetical protein [Achromobacter xylosoxidans]|uniref:hypothetical protein n=1 Tax=Alcaligenes xylosoxydans xylosoxydans TaxID=85698 RepID=UPI001F0D6A5F|nr:hypothetical protein [Achromobacter xylosoxidans]MCH4582520.1 hypothetical protein [Achromobacter xylosoxidans]
MSLLSELNSLLEKIPLWKRLNSVPKEIDELKERIARLEAAVNGGGSGDICPKCRKPTFELTDTAPDPTFGDLGVQRRTYRCSSCGHSEFKQLG